MKLSEELIWRGFRGETITKDPAMLEERELKLIEEAVRNKQAIAE